MSLITNLQFFHGSTKVFSTVDLSPLTLLCFHSGAFDHGPFRATRSFDVELNGKSGVSSGFPALRRVVASVCHLLCNQCLCFSISAPVNKITVHSTHQPPPSQSVLVRSSLCIPPTSNPPLQSVRVCPTSASATTVHCVFHLPQSELVLSISTPVNENHFCRPHNRQPDRSQCLWIPWCAFRYVLPFCSFCLLAITPMQSVPVCPTPVSETTIQSVLHLSAITELRFLFLHQ